MAGRRTSRGRPRRAPRTSCPAPANTAATAPWPARGAPQHATRGGKEGAGAVQAHARRGYQSATAPPAAAARRGCPHWQGAQPGAGAADIGRVRAPVVRRVRAGSQAKHDCHVARQERHGPPGVLDEAVRGDGGLDVRQRERRRRRQALAGLQAGAAHSGPRSPWERVTSTPPGHSDIAFCSTRKERGTSMQETQLPCSWCRFATVPCPPARARHCQRDEPAGRGDPGQLDAAVRRPSAPHTQATNLVNSRGRHARRQRLRSRQRGRNGCHTHGPARPPAGRGSLSRRCPARQARQGAVPAQHAGAGGEHGRHGW
jgi:hypothetical protein